MKKHNALYELRMKYERAGITDVEALNRETEKYLENHRLSDKEIHILAGIYDYVAENIERERFKYYTREEWEELERQYVHRASFTGPDLEDFLLTRLEKGKITRQQMEEERKRYKKCEHRFCLDYFIPRRKDQRFCCEDCRKRENEAIKEFERTSKIYRAGTYLPPSAYKEPRQVEKDAAYRKHERLFDSEILTKVMVRSEEHGYNDGKRNRATEERRNRASQIEKEVRKYEKVTGIVSKSVQETALNVEKGEMPVKKLAEK
ncbi:hypothetical protein A3Q35_01170 [Aeribacillus pallidus]|uniref:hypothetical protein n=1 Tax=Aeribacillus pallidus TaxID=33936 RepID=UPI0007B48ABA|nr:hypothetical protein [Aeribacillus pallidus]KZM55192.1 hypothetical protein A3Q35_01170 [Aeribacillus pallidus]